MAVCFGGAEGVGSTAVGGGSGSRHVDQGVHPVMEKEKHPTNKKRKVSARGPKQHRTSSTGLLRQDMRTIVPPFQGL
jgi:hypothetical protein